MHVNVIACRAFRINTMEYIVNPEGLKVERIGMIPRSPSRLFLFFQQYFSFLPVVVVVVVLLLTSLPPKRPIYRRGSCDYKVSHPPLLISDSSFRAIMVGMPWLNQTLRNRASYRFWFKLNWRPRRNPGSDSPYLSRYGARFQLPFWLCR